MINLENYLYERIKPVIDKWDEAGVYAISFFVYSNEAFTYKAYGNISEFAVSYNTEKDCGCAPELSEQRWNYAFWRQNTTHIINPHEENDEGLEVLFQWYKENGIENIGFESYDEYDANGYYTGKGPVGYFELLTAVSNTARRMQSEGFIAAKFGNVPIIVHELEYCWYVEKATEHANPNGEANIFLNALRMGFK